MDQVKEVARVRLLKCMPGTLPQIAARANVKPNRAKQIIKDLHQVKKVIHISGYKRPLTGGKPLRIFAVGTRKDAICKIKPFHPNEKAKIARERYRMDGRWEDKMAKQRAKREIEKTLTRAVGHWLGPLLMAA
jgi:hypothetical protein